MRVAGSSSHRLPLHACERLHGKRQGVAFRKTGREGSALHTMRACCHRSRPMVGAHTHRIGALTLGELRGKRPRFASQACHALAPRGVEALDVMGFPRRRADRPVLRRGHHPCIHHRLICGQRRVLTSGCRHLAPQARGTRAAAVPHVPGHSLTRRACAPSAGQNGPWHRLPPQAVGSARCADRRRGGHGDDPARASPHGTSTPDTHVRGTPPARLMVHNDMRSTRQRSMRAHWSSPRRSGAQHGAHWCPPLWQ
jgi:hypothetical protein